MDQFTVENEGTYTVQIHDGKAKNQSSLVLIGDGRPPGAPAGGLKARPVGRKTRLTSSPPVECSVQGCPGRG